MKRIAAIYVGVVLALSSASLYAESATVRFNLLDDYAILFPAILGNGRSIQVMFDTGSAETLLDNSLAKQLRLKSGAAVRIVLWEETIAAKQVTVDRLEIANLAFANQPMLAADLRRFSADLHTAVDLIIGYKMLCSLESFEIDYVAKALTLVRAPGEANHRCDDHSLPIVNAIIGGQKALRVLVDTGSKGLMLFGEGRDYAASNIDATGGRHTRLPG